MRRITSLLACLVFLTCAAYVARASIRIDANVDVLSRTTGFPAFGDNTRMIWMMRLVDTGADDVFFSLADADPFTQFLGTFVNAAADLLKVQTQGLGVSSAPGTTAIALSTWYHLAYVFDNTANTYNVYINGVLDTSGAVTGVTGTTIWGYESVGNINSGYPGHLNGRFGAYKMWNAVLTQEQIQAEMRYFAPVLMSGLHTWSPFRTATDLAALAGGTTWTAGGTLTTEADPPVSAAPGTMFLNF